jgi:hypothetical protein
VSQKNNYDTILWWIVGVFTGFALKSAEELFHLAYWAPPIGLLIIAWGQLDLLQSIKQGKTVNIKARAIDFIHWLLLVFIDIGAWLSGMATIWWFITKIVLLGIIAWQIGVGLGKQWQPTKRETWFGITAAIIACGLGGATGALRAMNDQLGWTMETVGLLASTGIVVWWIKTDLSTIREKAAGYPRSMFLKGLVNNVLITWFWAHVMVSSGGFHSQNAWYDNVGLTVNIFVGNLLYAEYYAAYEFHRWKQRV